MISLCLTDQVSKGGFDDDDIIILVLISDDNDHLSPMSIYSFFSLTCTSQEEAPSPFRGVEERLPQKFCRGQK